MVALDLRPMHLVEGKSFLELMAFLEPGYKVPSSAHISTLVMRKHSVAWNALKEILSKEAVAVGLTTDIWTSIATDAYITVSCHYISPEWEMRSFVLATKEFPERRTAIEIAQMLKEITTDFKIQDKVVCVVHDQASNMELAGTLLLEEQGWNTLKCTAHCLQLCLNAGFSVPAASWCPILIIVW